MGKNLPHHIKLMVSRKDDSFLFYCFSILKQFLFLLYICKFMKYLKDRIFSKYFLPYIMCTKLTFNRRIACAALVSLVKWKEYCFPSIKPCRHERLFGIHCKVYNCPFFEPEHLMILIPFFFVLLYCVFIGLPCKRILKFHCYYGYSV